jgi:hypothetical protein
MIVFPWFSAMMLALEANHVIAIRLRRLATLSALDANAELKLMVTEKAAAARHTAAILMRGGSTADVIGHYRKAVAANCHRLAPPTISGHAPD